MLTHLTVEEILQIGGDLKIISMRDHVFVSK